jgi:hypothetical protein
LGPPPSGTLEGDVQWFADVPVEDPSVSQANFPDSFVPFQSFDFRPDGILVNDVWTDDRDGMPVGFEAADRFHGQFVDDWRTKDYLGIIGGVFLDPTEGKPGHEIASIRGR